MPDTKTILVAVSDIFFYTKIRDAFLPHGYKLERLRTGDDWQQKALQSGAMGIIINMNDDRLNATDILKSLKALPQMQSLPILAFANHEEIGTWKLAKDLGIQKIVSRNEFSVRTLALFEEITASTTS
ncbi:MAG: histidine kinase [Nitrospirota bacterium]|jgi:response regulator RpfG family c-di-GMP phosphodiesterase|nr:histidine kinase [Nitrospirota bacterium]MDH5576355.1 histidine kinase [Nitrospirota bacterium]